MKNKKLLVFIAVPLAIVLILLGVLAFKDKKSDSDITPGNAPSSSESSDAAETVPDTELCFFSVRAPEFATVLFDDKAAEYNKDTGLYHIFTEKKDKHTLTVSKYGFETVTRDIIFEENGNSEIVVEMNATESYLKEAENAAKDYLMKIVDICNKGTGDLSTIIFFSDEDKTAVQAAVDSAIADMDVDTEEYLTSEISVNSYKCEGIADESKTISPENSTKGCVVSFTVEYTYTWKYNGENYKDSGIDSEVHKPIVTVENIDGLWYLKDIYIYFRKNVH